jgi:hypothetical protein
VWFDFKVAKLKELELKPPSNLQNKIFDIKKVELKVKDAHLILNKTIKLIT